MRRFFITALILVAIIYFTPFGTFIKPLFTSKSNWFEGTGVSPVGTGFYVSDNVVITDNHVIAGCERIVVGGKDKRMADAKVIATDVTNDLAAIKTSERVATVLFINDDAIVATGDKVAYPDYTSVLGEFDLNYTKVKVLNTDDTYTSIGIRLGNSGAPLVDEDGRVIGVMKASGFAGNITGYSIATNSERLTDFLNSHKIPFKVYHGPPGTLLNNPTYVDFIAVNIGCNKPGPWFTH